MPWVQERAGPECRAWARKPGGMVLARAKYTRAAATRDTETEREMRAVLGESDA